MPGASWSRPDMCGIAGRFNFDPTLAIDRQTLGAMTSAIAHRGPDADGFMSAAASGSDIVASASSIWRRAISRWPTRTRRSGWSSTAR
jgi:asparagine synthetase B (glutamine-hydrolysing)